MQVAFDSINRILAKRDEVRRVEFLGLVEVERHHVVDLEFCRNTAVLAPTLNLKVRLFDLVPFGTSGRSLWRPFGFRGHVT